MSELQPVLWSFYGEPGAFGLVILGALVFLGLASARAVIGDNGMDKPQRIGQLYGYTICLVSVVTFLTSTNALVRSLFTLANPIAAGAEPFRMGFEPSLSSFEAFRATYMYGPAGAAITVARRSARDTSGGVDTLTTAELRGRYEALRAERVGQVRHSATRQIVTSSVLILLAVVLFVVHWRWLRRREGVAAAAA